MTTNNYDYSTMTNPIKARWIALIQGVNIVADHCEASHRDFETMEIKSTAMKHFVKDSCLKICRDLDNMDKKDEKKQQFVSRLTNINKLAHEEKHEPACQL